MKQLFASYKLAQLAKEKGFDEETFKVYDQKGFIQNEKEMNELKLEFTKAPLYQQLFDWLRTKHKIHVEIMSLTKGNFTFQCYALPENFHVGTDDAPKFKSYNECIENALEEGFSTIKEKV